jgi:proteasome lid subunit RPN8/RPN11
MILFEPQALEIMVDDALSTFPDECCGFFFGRETGAERLVTQALVVDNAKKGDKRRRFEISPRDYLKAEALADERGLTLLGVYHSHPNHPALPSETDRLSAQPFFSYLIFSVMERKLAAVRSWRLNEAQQFEEETVNHDSLIKKYKLHGNSIDSNPT